MFFLVKQFPTSVYFIHLYFFFFWKVHISGGHAQGINWGLETYVKTEPSQQTSKSELFHSLHWSTCFFFLLSRGMLVISLLLRGHRTLENFSFCSVLLIALEMIRKFNKVCQEELSRSVPEKAPESWLNALKDVIVLAVGMGIWCRLWTSAHRAARRAPPLHPVPNPTAFCISFFLWLFKQPRVQISEQLFGFV